MRLALAVIALGLTCCGIATDYDLRAGWHHSDVTDSPWQYGYRTSFSSAFNQVLTGSSGASGYNYQTPSSGVIWLNETESTLYALEPNHIGIHPGTDFSPAVIRFISPEAGFFKVSGQFSAGDGGGVYRRKAIQMNDVSLMNVTNGAILPFNLGVKLTEGDTIDFQVDNMFAYGNTQIDALISPMEINSLTPSSGRVEGDTVVTATVTIDAPAPAGGAKIRLDSNNSAASVPTTVTIPEGSTGVNFDIQTHPVSANVRAGINAHWNGSLAKTAVVVTPPKLNSLYIVKTFIKGGQSTTGAVTLTHVAGPAGLWVSLSSSNASLVSVPSTVFVLPGHLSGTFNVSTSTVAIKTKVDVSASLNTRTRTVTMNLKP